MALTNHSHEVVEEMWFSRLPEELLLGVLDNFSLIEKTDLQALQNLSDTSTNLRQLVNDPVRIQAFVQKQLRLEDHLLHHPQWTIKQLLELHKYRQLYGDIVTWLKPPFDWHRAHEFSSSDIPKGWKNLVWAAFLILYRISVMNTGKLIDAADLALTEGEHMVLMYVCAEIGSYFVRDEQFAHQRTVSSLPFIVAVRNVVVTGGPRAVIELKGLLLREPAVFAKGTPSREVAFPGLHEFSRERRVKTFRGKPTERVPENLEKLLSEIGIDREGQQLYIHSHSAVHDLMSA